METNKVTHSDTQERDLVIVRTFDAPRERVFKAWSDPEMIKQWWGPKNFTVPVINIDFQVGGQYHFCMRSPEGKDYWSKGSYQEILVPERIVCTDSFADAEGNTVPASYYNMEGDWPLELLVTVTFEEEAGKTKFTLIQTGFPPEMIEMCKVGWKESFDKLEEVLK